VVVPRSTPSLIRDKLQALGASTVVHGDVWNEAHEKALEIVASHGYIYFTRTS